jgi:hypothetical protein
VNDLANDRARTLANYYPHDRVAAAYWYEDAIVLQLMVTEKTQAAWAKKLKKYLVEEARSDDGMLGVLILNVPDGAEHVGVMCRIAEVADKCGEQLMFKDNRLRDANTVDLFVQHLRGNSRT